MGKVACWGGAGRATALGAVPFALRALRQSHALEVEPLKRARRGVALHHLPVRHAAAHAVHGLVRVHRHVGGGDSGGQPGVSPGGGLTDPRLSKRAGIPNPEVNHKDDLSRLPPWHDHTLGLGA